MAKYRKKPVVIEATQWFKNGDHPQDKCEVIRDSDSEHGIPVSLGDGHVVRRISVEVPANSECKHCGLTMRVHGWIDTLEGGHIVCPGDFVITGIAGERYPCKEHIFAATYEAVPDPL